MLNTVFKNTKFFVFSLFLELKFGIKLLVFIKILLLEYAYLKLIDPYVENDSFLPHIGGISNFSFI